MFTRWKVASTIHILLPVLFLCGLFTSCAPSVAKPVAGPSVKAQKPAWKVGYWWEYAWERPGGSGTRTYEMVREDTFEGVPCYVIKRGRREYFYTKDVLGRLGRTDRGQLVRRRTPPLQDFSWPLEVGKKWRNAYRREKPQEGSSRNFDRRLVVTKFEKIKVPAGTFEAFKIERIDNRRNLVNEFWYAPKVKWLVKRRDYLRDGVTETELINYKVD